MRGRSGRGRDGDVAAERVANRPHRRQPLLPTADADILEYLTATVDTALEDGDDRAEALGDLLILVRAREDEDAVVMSSDAASCPPS